MERFSAEANWQLVLREEDGGFTILRAMTPDKGARLPETIFGKPVLALGRHALCHDKPLPVGREVELCCGNPQGEWDNGSLEELTLPESLKKVGDYAFLNCRKLRRLTMADSVQFWGSGALMNCRELRELHLAWDEEAGETLDYFVGELSRELEVQLTTPRGRAHLIFPEYTEIYEENIPATSFNIPFWGRATPITTASKSGACSFRLMTGCGRASWPRSMRRTVPCALPGGGFQSPLIWRRRRRRAIAAISAPTPGRP